MAGYFLRLDEELEVRLLVWRKQQPDLPGVQEAIRRLLREALERGTAVGDDIDTCTS